MASINSAVSSGENLVNNLIASSFAQQADAQTQDVQDNIADDAQQAALLKKLQAKQAQVRQQAKAHETFNQDTHAHKRFLDATGGKMGPHMQAWANNQQLQKKLTDKQRELFLQQAERDPAKANKSAEAIQQLTGTNEQLLGAEVSRQTFNDVHEAVAKRPDAQKNLSEALNSKIMREPRGDRTTKQDFMRFSTRPDAPGVSVRRGGDMLGTLSSRNVPGFAQQASMKMIGRDPNNLEGIDTVDNFVQVPEVDQLPRMAKGRATESLARANGAKDVADGFVTVARDPKFKQMGREQKARLFSVMGEGRTSDLRAITDQTLSALRSSKFPAQKAQIGAFLSNMGAQLGRAKERGDSKIDTQAALVAAKRGSMPQLPTLKRTDGLSDEEARTVRGQNRAQVMRFYSKLRDHYGELDHKMASAKYRQEVHIGVMVKQPEHIDTSALNVRPQTKESFDKTLGDLRGQLDQKQISRSDFVQKLGQLRSEAFGRGTLTDDELTWVHAQLSQGEAEMSYHDLSSKKNKRMRELGDSIMPPAEFRKRAAPQRTSGAQPRYFRVGGDKRARGVRTLPLPGEARSATSQTSNERWLRASGGAGPSQPPSPSGQAPARGSQRSMQNFQARVSQLESNLSPNLSPQERYQKLTELVTGELQQHFEAMAAQMVSQAMQTLGRAGGAVAAAAQSSSKAASVRAQPQREGRGVQGKTNSWGIQRTWERDLGAGHGVQAVRTPRSQPTDEEGAGELLRSGEQGQVLKPTTEIRPPKTLNQLGWKEMSQSEQAVMRNLGWDAQRWEARYSAGASWPTSYTQSFAQLRPAQRASVYALGFGAADWDRSAADLAAYADNDGT